MMKSVKKKPVSLLVEWIHHCKEESIRNGHLKRDTRAGMSPDAMNAFGFEVSKSSRASTRDRLVRAK